MSVKLRVGLLVFLCGLVGLPVFLCRLWRCANRDPWIAGIYRVYAADDWRPQIDYCHNVAGNWWSSSMLPPAPVGQLVSVETLHPSDIAHYIWESPDVVSNAEGMVRVRGGSSFVEAVRLMMEDFAYSSAFQPFPQPTGVCTNLGDVCYTGYPAGSSGSLKFIRNNIYVFISSSDENWSTNTAFTIDAAILNASTNTVSNNWLQRLMNK